MTARHVDRQLKLRVIEALERRAKQFRSYENIWPFRVPHEPLTLDAIVDEALAEDGGSIAVEALKTRTVVRLTFGPDGDERGDGLAWEAWVIGLPSGVMLYCDDAGDERRILASVKRGNPIEADGFFLELLAETGGEAFGIEMTGAVPDRVRTSVADRDFILDVFVELFEGTDAEPALRSGPGGDFRNDVDRWLSRAWVAPPARTPRRQPRRRDEMP
jgi:hypothetical protein